VSTPTLGSWSGSLRSVEGVAVANATIIVLSGQTDTVNTTTQPGTPLASIYSDPYGNNAINQSTSPLQSDGLGNYQFWAAPGWYVLQIYGAGIYQIVDGETEYQAIEGIAIGNAGPVSISQFPTTGTWAFAGTFSANPTFSGNPIFSGNPVFSGDPVFSGELTAAHFNNFYWVTGNSSGYLNLAAAVTAAKNAGGGTIFDAYPETFSADPFTGLGETAGPSIRIIFAPGTWSTKVPITVPALTQLIGAGRSLTTFQSVSGYAQGSGRATCIFDVYGTVGTIISDMAITCGNGATQAIYATDINENSGFERLAIANFSVAGIQVNAAGYWDEPAQNYFLRDIEAGSGTAGTSSTYGLWLQGNGGGGPSIVENITASGQVGNVIGAGVAVYNFNGGTFLNIHSEQSQAVFLMLSTGVSNIGARNVSGGPAVSGGQTVISIPTTVTGNSFVFENLSLNSATTLISDVPRSITNSDDFMSYYIVGTGAISATGIFSSNPGIGTIFPGTILAKSDATAAAFIATGATPVAPSGQIAFGASTAATATGGSGTLPAAPVGFIVINIGGGVAKIPYYAA
jgi:hypothetical protein